MNRLAEATIRGLAWLLAIGFLLLIASMLVADLRYASLESVLTALKRPEIRFALRMTLLTSSLSTIVSIWIALPLGYFLTHSKSKFRGIVQWLVDVPVTLPPLVVGVSLLILFHQRVFGFSIEELCRSVFGLEVTHHWPAIVVAQVCVAGSLATRTLQVAMSRLDPKTLQVARVAGCGPFRAFVEVTLPQLGGGIRAAATLAFSRCLGEFGPVFVFAGATRMKTEVLSTSVFLEWSVGDLRSAVAISMILVLLSLGVMSISHRRGDSS